MAPCHPPVSRIGRLECQISEAPVAVCGTCSAVGRRSERNSFTNTNPDYLTQRTLTVQGTTNTIVPCFCCISPQHESTTYPGPTVPAEHLPVENPLKTVDM